MAAQDKQNAAVEYFAARSHDAWRAEFLKNNPDQKDTPRMRMRGGKMVDINQPWKSLDPAAKADNKIAAQAAYDAIERFPKKKNREKASAYVHKQWIKRNRADPNQSQDLFKPYAELPEIEKDKDRAHIDQMKAALKAVKAKKTGKKAKKAKAAIAPQLDAKTAARLSDAAAALSAATGRNITAQALLTAGAEAVLAICETAAPAKRKKKR